MRSDGNGSTRRPEEIQAEIRRTREQMDGTLSAIEQRFTPGQLVDQGLNYLRQSGGQEFVSNLGQQAKQNPLPVVLVGIGLAWLMATGKTGSNSATEPELSGPGLGERASQARARLSETASAVRDKAAAVREQPLALGAIGLAIGALAAALAPRAPQPDRPEGNPETTEQIGSSGSSDVRDAMTEERWREEQREPPV